MKNWLLCGLLLSSVHVHASRVDRTCAATMRENVAVSPLGKKIEIIVKAGVPEALLEYLIPNRDHFFQFIGDRIGDSLTDGQGVNSAEMIYFEKATTHNPIALSLLVLESETRIQVTVMGFNEMDDFWANQFYDRYVEFHQIKSDYITNLNNGSGLVMRRRPVASIRVAPRTIAKVWLKNHISLGMIHAILRNTDRTYREQTKYHSLTMLNGRQYHAIFSRGATDQVVLRTIFPDSDTRPEVFTPQN